MIKMKKFVLGMMLTATLGVNAATIAVIDSGTDVEHVDFQGKIWMNPGETANNGRDEDGNGYQDDVYGWNFAESNNMVIDRSYLGTFSNDPYKFFELQGKAFMGTITQEEKEWINNYHNTVYKRIAPKASAASSTSSSTSRIPRLVRRTIGGAA